MGTSLWWRKVTASGRRVWGARDFPARGDFSPKMSKDRFSNPWPHAEHGVMDILKWKLMPWLVRDRAEFPDLKGPAGWQVADLSAPSDGEWKVTWLGHASFLIQGRGRRLLVDPVFSSHCSPVPLPSLRRLVEPPCAVADLTPVDAVLLTHSHYDHLDLATLRELMAVGGDCQILVAEGHGGWLRGKGFHRVEEVRWGECSDLIDGLRIHSTPAQHFTARSLRDRNRGHWCGWLIDDGEVKIWHAGDSGYCDAFLEIGGRYGFVDFAMIPIGAYSPRSVMRAMHLNPREAVRVFSDVQCRFAVGMHWGTFRLTDEPMGEPPELLRLECEKAGLGEDRFVIGKIGESWTVGPVT